METHIEKMKASHKQSQVTDALNSLIQHALMANGMPQAKKYEDYSGGGWQDAWDYINQYILDSTCNKLTRFHATVEQTLDIINQPIYDRKFGQFSKLLATFKQLAHEFREPHNLLETHNLYGELYQLYKVHIIPLSLSIFNSIVDALPSAEIYIEQIDSMTIIEPERIDFSNIPNPVSNPVQKKPESNVAFDDDIPPELLVSDSSNPASDYDDSNSEDNDVAVAMVMSLTAPPIPSSDFRNNNNIPANVAAVNPDDEEELAMAIALSVSENEQPPPAAPRVAPLLTRAREFFAQLGRPRAAPPPPAPTAPEESSSDTDEAVKEFRKNFW